MLNLTNLLSQCSKIEYVLSMTSQILLALGALLLAIGCKKEFIYQDKYKTVREWNEALPPRGSGIPKCSSLEDYLEGGPYGNAEQLASHGVTSFNLYWFVKDCKIPNLEQLISKLPLRFTGNWILNYHSSSLQLGTPSSPRIIMFGEDGKMLFGISSNKEDPTYSQLEIIEWDDKSASFTPHQIIFHDSGENFENAEFKINPTVCHSCHSASNKNNSRYQSLEFRPFFSAYNFWPHFFGSLSRRGITRISCVSSDDQRPDLVQKWKEGKWGAEYCTGKEAKLFLNWVKYHSEKGRFKFLPRSTKIHDQDYLLNDWSFYHEKFLFRATVNQDHVILGPVNGSPRRFINTSVHANENAFDFLTNLLMNLNAKRMAKQIAKALQAAPEYKFLYKSFVRNCFTVCNSQSLDTCDQISEIRPWSPLFPAGYRILGETFTEFYERLNREQQTCDDVYRGIEKEFNSFGDAQEFNQFKYFDKDYKDPFTNYAILAFASQKPGIDYSNWSITPPFIKDKSGTTVTAQCHQFMNTSYSTFTGRFKTELSKELAAFFPEESKTRECGELIHLAKEALITP